MTPPRFWFRFDQILLQTLEQAGFFVERIDKLVEILCLGMDGVHGVTLAGGNAVSVTLPDWSAPGAVKTGDCELVCGLAVKATRAAGVLHPKAAA